MFHKVGDHAIFSKTLSNIRTGNLKKAELITAMSSLQSPMLSTFKTQAIKLPNYKALHYGAFCRLESKIEATSKVPVRFRLGSLDYVNYLEQKFILKRPGPAKNQE